MVDTMGNEDASLVFEETVRANDIVEERAIDMGINWKKEVI